MIELCYEDRDLLVCVKPPDCLSEDGPGEGCLPRQLAAQYRAAGKPDFIAGVHRLDNPVGGLMVFSRRKAVTGKLISAMAEHRVCKEYLAVLRGVPAAPEGVLRDLLFRDAAKNKTYVVKRMRKGVREAALAYRVLAVAEGMSLVRIRLYTGRTHQIRAQFSSRGLPLVGDGRYGGKDPRCGPALWSFHMALAHPVTGAPLDFVHRPPDAYPWICFPAALLKDGSAPLPPEPENASV